MIHQITESTKKVYIFKYSFLNQVCSTNRVQRVPWFHAYHAFIMLFLFYKSMEKAWYEIKS